MGNKSNIEAVVCIATFRRPEILLKTLESITNQETDIRFSISIVDNDAENPVGLAAAQNYLKDFDFPTHFATEKQQGNVFALNKVFSESYTVFPTAKFFLMIDDDEIASPQWIQKMVTASINYEADVVGGPVFSKFEIMSDLIDHPAFIPAYNKSGYVPRIYGSGNCLITRKIFDKFGKQPLDIKYNFLGGADTDFFTRIAKSGFISYWEQQAEITELVPSKRLNKQWLIERSLRIGSLNVLVEQKTKIKILTLIKSLLILPYATLRSLKLLLKGNHWIIASHPIFVACGRFLAHFNRLPEPYKA